VAENAGLRSKQLPLPLPLPLFLFLGDDSRFFNPLCCPPQ
jgi:hypothetical protein